MTYDNTISFNHQSFIYRDLSFSTADEYGEIILDFVRKWISGASAFQLQSSGSTGSPKEIAVSRAQMMASAKATLSFLDIKKNTPVTLCIDAGYIGGKMQIVRALCDNLPLQIVSPSSKPASALGSFSHLGLISLVPLQLIHLLGEAPEILNKATAILVGGAPVGEDIYDSVQNIKAPIYHTYGMTETVSHIALSKLNSADGKGVFHLLPGINCRLDERGCLVVNGSVTDHADVVTNDIVEFKSPTSFTWKGRIDNMVNSGGVKLFPEEIDKLISKLMSELFPARQFFTYGVPDQRLGHMLALFVEAKAQTDDEIASLKTKLKDLLPIYHSPREIFFCDRFQQTANGKIKKKETVYSILS